MEKKGVISIKELQDFLNVSYRSAQREIKLIRDHYKMDSNKRVFWSHIYKYYHMGEQ